MNMDNLCAAIVNGDIQTVQSIIGNNNVGLDEKRASKIMIYARNHAQKEIFEWLYKTHPICREVDIGEYIMNGEDCIDMYKWLFTNKYMIPAAGNILDPILFFDENVALDFLTWLLDVYPQIEFPASALSHAIREDKLEIVKWIFKHNVDPTSNPLYLAAKYENLRILNWLYENNKNLNISIDEYLYLKKSASKEVLNWFANKGIFF